MEYNLSKYNNPIIIIYGGTFSPFTMYNLKIAEDVTKEIYDKHKGLRNIVFYFVPTHSNYKSSNIKNNYIGGNSKVERINMLEIVCKHLNVKKGIYYKVSTNEINANKPIDTYDSIIDIQKHIMKNNKIVVNNDIQVILIERHVKEILNGKWANPLSLLSKNIIMVSSQHTQLNIHLFEKEINILKMKENEKNIKNKEYLNLLSSNKKYLLSKINIFNFTKEILIFTPSNTYDKLQDYYNAIANVGELNKYIIPELCKYIIKNNLYKKHNKSVKNIKTKQNTKKKYK